MTVAGLGHISVPTPGTPVLLKTVLTNIPSCGQLRLYVTPLQGNAGKTYVGVVGMSKSTGVGVLKQLQIPPANGFNDSFTLEGVAGGAT